MKTFSGTLLYLDRSDINTDEIIPAKYLTEITKEALKPHLLEDLRLKDFDPLRDLAGKSAIVSRANFGCGSSREHAVWALEEGGITVVVAEHFARIFRQNMFNCGLLAIELPKKEINKIFALRTDATVLDVNFAKRELSVNNAIGHLALPFKLSEFDAKLVEAGGWVEYADSKY
jgi:3-isopropylmalate/(R)-2-methylmalate dehydratase small subunit